MNHGIKHISIPQPCTQNWADMDIVAQGRCCQNCQKTVTDFTKLTNEQILEVLSSSGNVCGRFDDTQLKVLNATIGIEPAIPRFSWKRFSLAAAFIGFVPFIKANAQTKPQVHTVPISNKSDTLAARQVKVELKNETAELKKDISSIPAIPPEPDEIMNVMGGVYVQVVEETPNRSTQELIRDLFRF